jgi:hypothetical protein
VRSNSWATRLAQQPTPLAPIDRNTHKATLPVANVAMFIVMLAFNGISASGKLSSTSIGDVARMYETLINPASYAFSIWGIIYTGVGVFCAWQCSPAHRCDYLVFDRIGYWFVASCVANILWIVCFVQGTPVAWIWVSTVLLFAIVTTLLAILLRCRVWTRAFDAPADQASDNGTSKPSNPSVGVFVSYVAVDLTFSVYCGWCTAASIINATGALIGGGHYGGAHPDQYAIAMLVVAALVFLAVILRPCSANWAFGFVFTWAAVAISKGDQCGGLVKKGAGEVFRTRANGGSLGDEEACARVQATALACAVLVGVVAGGRLSWWVWKLTGGKAASRAGTTLQ